MAGSGLLSPMKIVRKMTPNKLAVRSASRWLPQAMLGKSSEAGQSLGKIGPLEVCLANSVKELRLAQRLRYEVFYEEMSAVADAQTQLTRLDRDRYDDLCDHLLVLDHNSQVRNKPFSKLKPQIVGTYRVLRQEIADQNGGFYTAGEFDIQRLMDRHSDLNFMELGRSCVLKPYRTKKSIELLWHGIWSYVLMHNVDVMIGCASIEGTDPDQLAEQLSFLHHFASAPDDWQVSALPDQYVDMNRLPKDKVDYRAALRSLPPLLKGYLRLGAFFGNGAVIDHQFGTTDVLIIMPVSKLNPRYVSHYGEDASRYSS